MNKLKILIADDEEMLRDLYEMILESEFSCETTKVSSGTDAINALKSSAQFDIIISDYNMPGGTGGQVYLFNKNQTNVPFFLFSGGELGDFNEFKDFHETNRLNQFFNKPFNDRDLLDAVAKINISPAVSEITTNDQFIKVKLSYYALHSKSSAEVYLKLSDNKYTKIINANEDNIPDKDLLEHYLKKDIDYIYVERSFFKLFLNDVFNKFYGNIDGEKKAETLYQVSGLNFHVSFEGLNDVGISSQHIEKVNEVIEETIDSLLKNPRSKNQFLKLCENEGFVIGHSMLIMYIAGRICRETNLNFASTMKKICSAAFYHDLSLFELDVQHDEMKLNEISDVALLKQIIEHPLSSANYLQDNIELLEDTKKIIVEHHEMPNGDGYPKKLTASQISPLSCLFILSQQITFCLIRNNFSPERLRDFLKNSESAYNQGNFAKFFIVAETIF
ncbi:MAG: response regulator [Bacteriovorax sp.]|nr:response regulator [Bacteriovorax sp.]